MVDAAMLSVSVLCCRMSPDQKAEVVLLVNDSCTIPGLSPLCCTLPSIYCCVLWAGVARKRCMHMMVHVRVGNGLHTSHFERADVQFALVNNTEDPACEFSSLTKVFLEHQEKEGRSSEKHFNTLGLCCACVLG